MFYYHRQDRRPVDDKDRRGDRYERHFNKDRSPATSTTGRGREISPGPRPGNQGRRIKEPAGWTFLKSYILDRN